MIKLTQIRQFVVLAEQGSFHRAANVLNMAQPPLSVGIRKLEEDLGAALFVRGSRGVSLTPVGVAALGSARAVLAKVGEMRNTVKASLVGEGGRLRVGFVASATLELLPRLLLAFRARYPQVELKLEESRTAALLQDVADGRVDVAIVRTPVMSQSRAAIELLQKDRMCLAVRKGSKWSGLKHIRLGLLKDEPFVLFSRDTVPSMHFITMLLCQQAGFVPIIAEEAGQMQTILCLVESGIGVALVPSVAVHQGNGFELIEIEGVNDQCAVGLALALPHGTTDAAAINFGVIARDVCQAEAR